MTQFSFSWLCVVCFGFLAPDFTNRLEPQRLSSHVVNRAKEKTAEEMLLPAPKPLPAEMRDGNCENCPKPAPLPPPELPTPVVTLQVLAPADSGDRKEIEYRLLVENRSPMAAHHVTVKNALPKNATYVRSEPVTQPGSKELRWELGTLEAGERRAILLVLAPTGPGKVVNCARVAFEHGVCVETCTAAKAAEKPVEPPPPTPPTVPLEMKQGRISLNIKAPERQAITSNVTYQLTVTNEGNVPATDLVLNAKYPSGSVFVSGSGAAQHLGLEAKQVRWHLGTLEAGKSLTVELQLRATMAGKLILQAEANGQTSSGAVRAQRQAETEIYGAGALHLEVVDTLDPLLVGEETQYTILVRNQGAGPLTNIRLTALAPPEIGVIRVQGAVNFRKEGQMVVYDAFDLLPKTETLFRITAQAVKAGFVRFAVTLTADQLPKGTVREEEATNIVSDPDTEQARRPWQRIDAAKPRELGK